MALFNYSIVVNASDNNEAMTMLDEITDYISESGVTVVTATMSEGVKGSK